MSQSQPVERSVVKRLTTAWEGTEAAKFLAAKKGGKAPAGSFLGALKNDAVHSNVWRAAFPKPLPETAKERSEIAISSSWLHLHPATMSRRALRFTVTYGLGGFAAALFFILAVTGLLLMFFYVPSVDHAYKDMVDLQTVVSLGKILRNMHRWSAHAMVIVVCLHMLRVFLQKAYEGPRQLNWVIGVVLLVITMLLSFTGYLLPWDQLALWAITVGTNMAGAIPVVGEKIRFIMLGGDTVDQPTLIRFFVLHVIFLPSTLGIIMAYHFWRVRKDGFHGGLATTAAEAEAKVPDAGVTATPVRDLSGKEYGVLGFIEGKPRAIDEYDHDRVSVYPHLIAREFLAFGLLFATLLLVSFLFDAPLEELANPGKTPNPAKAPWYFLSLQELLHYSPPFIAGVVIPGLLVLTVCTIPFFRRRISLFPIAFLISSLILPLFDGLIWQGIHAVLPDFADAIRVYGLPTFALLMASIFVVGKIVLHPRFDDEAVVEKTRKKWFLTFVGMLFILVMIGQFFRGPEWRWVWPWQ